MPDYEYPWDAWIGQKIVKMFSKATAQRIFNLKTEEALSSLNQLCTRPMELTRSTLLRQRYELDQTILRRPAP